MEDVFVAGEEMVFLLDNAPDENMVAVPESFHVIDLLDSDNCKHGPENNVYSNGGEYDNCDEAECDDHVQ